MCVTIVAVQPTNNQRHPMDLVQTTAQPVHMQLRTTSAAYTTLEEQYQEAHDYFHEARKQRYSHNHSNT